MTVRGTAPGWRQAGVKGVGSPYPPGAETLLQTSSLGQWSMRCILSLFPWLRATAQSLTPHLIHPMPHLQQPKISYLLPLTLPFLSFSPSSAMGPLAAGPDHFVHPPRLLIQHWNNFLKMIPVSLGEMSSPFLG